ncbi:MAG: mechanosensitive ion channel family protein [Halobacteriaceae archaeon]
MTVYDAVVRWIQSQTPTQDLQILATIAVALGVVGIGVLINRAGRYAGDRFEPTVVETVQTLVMSMVLTAGGVGTLIVWRADDNVAQALAAQNLGIGQLLATAAVILGAYVLTRLTKRFIQGFATDASAFSGHQREIIHHTVQVTVFLFAFLVVLSLWQIDLGNLLLGAGVLGVVLGLAARQTLGAVLAGFVVLFSRPFEVGDWVVVEDTEGVVREITIVNTRIRTVDGETVMVPNDIITGTTVRNRSRQGRLRIEVQVGVDYETDLDAALGIAADAMTGLDTVLDAPEPHAVLDEFGDSAVVLSLRFWIDNPSARRYWRARTAVVRAVKQAFEAGDIAIPFPQRELTARGGGEATALGVPPAEEGEATVEDSSVDDDD